MTNRLSDVWFKVTDLEVAEGAGCWVTTTDGDRYLDFSSGIAVASTGHCHPAVVEAITRQAQRFIHAQANVYTHDLMAPLAARLEEITPVGIDRFFFANSGAEATEAAVKLAKQVTGRPNVVVFSGSFHGRTHLTMAMTTSKSVYRAGHQPLPSGVFVAPFPDLVGAEPDRHDALIDAALHDLDELLATQTAPSETAAMVLEPVLGEGGYVPCPTRFIEGVAATCRRHDILFVADEVQSGFGRTGRMFAVEHFDVDADVLIMAKGIASGFPLSAIGARADLMERWPTGSHGGTYGGNPIGCAAALATIDVLAAPGFLDAVNARAEQLLAGIGDAVRDHADVVDVRGLGLMIGTQFATPAGAAAVQRHMLEESHVITMTAGPHSETLRWMPPLVVDAVEIELGLDAFRASLKALG